MAADSQHEIEVKIMLIMQFFGGEEAQCSSLRRLRLKAWELSKLMKNLEEVKKQDASLRTVKGVEVQSPLARSWHK